MKVAVFHPSQPLKNPYVIQTNAKSANTPLLWGENLGKPDFFFERKAQGLKLCFYRLSWF